MGLTTTQSDIPAELPFLQAICWDLDDVKLLTPDEMLSRYERGWRYCGVLADLEGEDLRYVRQLARVKGSWLQTHV